MTPDEFLKLLQTILAACNIVIILYGFYKFLGKPHESLESRIHELEGKSESKIKELEGKIEELERFVVDDRNRTKEQNATNEILLSSVFALVECMMQNVAEDGKQVSPGLAKAKEELNRFLVKKRGE